MTPSTLAGAVDRNDTDAGGYSEGPHQYGGVVSGTVVEAVPSQRVVVAQPAQRGGHHTWRGYLRYLCCGCCGCFGQPSMQAPLLPPEKHDGTPLVPSSTFVHG
jgi:hypothetical protein|eukprot:COSAG01_NODE_10342_length_2189_cov_11.369856_2_plen_103_part_00